jgi:hypothetical protein
MNFKHTAEGQVANVNNDILKKYYKRRKIKNYARRCKCELMDCFSANITQCNVLDFISGTNLNLHYSDAIRFHFNYNIKH